MKRFAELFKAALVARTRVPDLQLVIVGEGPERVVLESLIAAHDAAGWVSLRGHIGRHELLALYQQAWLVTSASLAEGWGLTLTEAAACGVPAVATDISGHRCSVVDGETGVLADLDHLGDTIADVLQQPQRRAELAAAALRRARELTWDNSALGIIDALHHQVLLR
ncbi:MAG TPA: glycosyltransferase, partial [Ilumatobacteraceae bacterium]|nr:glycosyltransferase [Ilumatobacteraceae bacterium]